jgi:hypothetical protein
MAIIASGVNSGSGFGSSDAVTSTNLNNHVNAATFASGAVDEDTCTLTGGKIAVKAGSSSTGLEVGNFEHIATAKVLGRTTVSTGAVELVDVVGTAGILKNDDALGTSDTQGATQGNIKAYVDGGGGFTPATYTGGESVTFPNGLIMKWGEKTITGDSTGTYVFGTAFPNECIQAQATLGQGGFTSNDAGCGVDTLSTTSLRLINGFGSSRLIRWFAIGR